MDKETQSLLAEGKIYRELVESEGWAKATTVFNDLIAEILNIANLPDKDLENEIKARKLAVTTMRVWMNGIIARANQSETIEDALASSGDNLFLEQ